MRALYMRALTPAKRRFVYAVPLVLAALLSDAYMQGAVTKVLGNNVLNPFLTLLGDGRTDFLLSLVLLGFNRKAGKAAVAAFFTSGVAVNLIKFSVGRARPYTALSPWAFTGPTVDGAFSSFPSGHTATISALAAVVAKTYPRSAPACYVLAGLVGLSRVATSMHWPSDVLAGAFLGVLAAGYWIGRQEIE